MGELIVKQNLVKSFGDFSTVLHPRRNVQLDTIDILRIEGSSSYSKVVCKSGITVVVTRELGWFAGCLPQWHFIRIHKSHIVNKNFIIKKEPGNKLILANGEVLPVSREMKFKFLINCNNHE